MNLCARYLVIAVLFGACGDGGDDEEGSSTPASCVAFGANLAVECERDSALDQMTCEEDRLQYEPVGCGAEFAEYVRCFSEAKIPDCNEGPAECTPDGYLRCQSQFVQRTGCSRLVGMDAECDGDQYAFGCLQEIPKGCTRLASGGSLAMFACCPSYASGDAVHFED